MFLIITFSTMTFTVEPIGYFHTLCKKVYDVPRQATLSPGSEGIIQLNAGCHFEAALEGLADFDLIWILFRFHQHQNWKPKVLPPRATKKQGVFETRSPHRPNFTGMSCVELKEIHGLQLLIKNHDLIDGTPIIDIKPYLNYADALFAKRQGWLESLPEEVSYTIEWSLSAQEQIDYLKRCWTLDLKSPIENRLHIHPLPLKNNRIKKRQWGGYCLAYQTWRVYYHVDETVILIDTLASGYDEQTLRGDKSSSWEDIPIHLAFVERFSDTTDIRI